MLQFTHVKKSYSGRLILAIDQLQLQAGCYWLQGPNGAGKTTLLRMIAGLVPFEGDISLGGLSLKKERVAYSRLVSWADAEPLYPDYLKGRDLLDFYHSVREAPAAQVEGLVNRFKMRSWLSARVGTWSSGMLKKLSLVLAFIGEPTLVLLDEPLVTLDQESIPLLLEMICNRRERGASFLISSHQPLTDRLLPSVGSIRLLENALHLVEDGERPVQEDFLLAP